MEWWGKNKMECLETLQNHRGMHETCSISLHVFIFNTQEKISSFISVPMSIVTTLRVIQQINNRDCRDSD
jgi:hypothetical protein